MLEALATADKAEEITAARRVVSLRANWETQYKLADWAKSLGFDLGWSYSGWPQASEDFDFHVTIIATKNKVKIPDLVRHLDDITLTPVGWEALGNGDVPAMLLEKHDTLDGIRSFFVLAYGAKPTFDEFKPHITVSYRWNGEPQLLSLPFPQFPLVFNRIRVGILDDDLPSSGRVGDAADEGLRHVMRCFDAVPLAGTRKTADGFLQVEARVARTGMQDYLGSEVGDLENPNKVYKVWRSEDEIFKASSLATFAHKPVTMGHPTRGVDAANWKKEAIGSIGSEVIRDGQFVRVPMVIMDQPSIDMIEAGTREISMGYDTVLLKTPGVTADGQAYDAIQTQIRINHAAFVPKGRAGHECRVGDEATANQHKDEDTMSKKTILVDNAPHEVPTVVADRIATLEAQVAENATWKASITKLVADAEAEAVVRAEATKAKDAEIADLKTKILSDADLDKAVAARLAVIADAKKIAPEVVTDGKSLADIRAEAVRVKTGDKFEGRDAVKDAQFFDGVFSGLLGQAKTAPTADVAALMQGTGDSKPAADPMLARYQKSMVA